MRPRHDSTGFARGCVAFNRNLTSGRSWNSHFPGIGSISLIRQSRPALPIFDSAAQTRRVHDKILCARSVSSTQASCAFACFLRLRGSSKPPLSALISFSMLARSSYRLLTCTISRSYKEQIKRACLKRRLLEACQRSTTVWVRR